MKAQWMIAAAVLTQLSATPSSDAPKTPAGGVDARLIAGIQKTYRNIPTLRGKFSQSTYIALLDKTDVSEGEFAFKKPGKLKWTYRNAGKKQYISDGKTLWVLSHQDKQVWVHPRARQAQDKLAMDFLWGLANLEKSFSVTAPGAKETQRLHKGDGDIRLKLIPKEQQGSIEFLVAALDSKTRLVTQLLLFNRNGNRVHYRFHRMQSGIDLPDTLFTQTIPKGYHRIEIP